MTLRLNYVAPHDEAKHLELEPWGEVFVIAAGSFVTLELTGTWSEPIESRWTERGWMIWPPPGAVVRVLSESGAVLGDDFK